MDSLQNAKASSGVLTRLYTGQQLLDTRLGQQRTLEQKCMAISKTHVQRKSAPLARDTTTKARQRRTHRLLGSALAFDLEKEPSLLDALGAIRVLSTALTGREHATVGYEQCWALVEAQRFEQHLHHARRVRERKEGEEAPSNGRGVVLLESVHNMGVLGKDVLKHVMAQLENAGGHVESVTRQRCASDRVRVRGLPHESLTRQTTQSATVLFYTMSDYEVPQLHVRHIGFIQPMPASDSVEELDEQGPQKAEHHVTYQLVLQPGIFLRFIEKADGSSCVSLLTQHGQRFKRWQKLYRWFSLLAATLKCGVAKDSSIFVS